VDSAGTDLLALLSLIQVSDSSFPVGRFVHSNGVEAWLNNHETAGCDEILKMMHCYVSESYAPLDGAAMGHAWRLADADEQVELDRLVTAYKPFEYARVGSESCGRLLARLAQQVLIPEDRAPFITAAVMETTPGNLCVVEGVLFRALGIGLTETVLYGIRAAFAGMLSATVRLGRIGPIAAQRWLNEGREWLVELTRLALATSRSDLRAACPEIEIYAARGQGNSTSLFMT
jgi:urease accessory protein